MQAHAAFELLAFIFQMAFAVAVIDGVNTRVSFAKNIGVFSRPAFQPVVARAAFHTVVPIAAIQAVIQCAAKQGFGWASFRACKTDDLIINGFTHRGFGVFQVQGLLFVIPVLRPAQRIALMAGNLTVVCRFTAIRSIALHDVAKQKCPVGIPLCSE